MICVYPKLEPEKLKEVESLEKQMGKTILAFSCRDIKPSMLKEDELDEIRGLEKQLGVSLVAVEEK